MKKAFKMAKKKAKEDRIQELAREYELEEFQRLGNELLEILEACASLNEEVPATKIKSDANRFRAYLDNFGSNKEFWALLNVIKTSGDTPKRLKTFITEYKGIMNDKISHQKFLRWLNGTIYKQRHLLTVAFSQFFNERAKPVVVTKEYTGTQARARMSDRRKTKEKKELGNLKAKLWKKGFSDKGTKEKVRKLQERQKRFVDKTKTTWTERKLEYVRNNGLLMSDRQIPKGMLWRYGCLISYTWKFAYRGLGRAYPMKWKQKRDKQRHYKRIQKTKTEAGIDYIREEAFLHRVNQQVMQEMDIGKRRTMIRYMLTKWKNWGKLPAIERLKRLKKQYEKRYGVIDAEVQRTIQFEV